MQGKWLIYSLACLNPGEHAAGERLGLDGSGALERLLARTLTESAATSARASAASGRRRQRTAPLRASDCFPPPLELELTAEHERKKRVLGELGAPPCPPLRSWPAYC